MNTLQLTKILKSDPAVAPTFLGVFPSDRLPNIEQRRNSFVANTAGSSDPGKHWVAFYIHDETCIFFDSYGNPPSGIFKKFVDKYALDYNHHRLQGPLSSTCGQFCVYFLLHIVRGYSLNDIVSAFGGFDDNDQAVTDFVNLYFDIDTEVLDLRMFI